MKSLHIKWDCRGVECQLGLLVGIVRTRCENTGRNDAFRQPMGVRERPIRRRR